MFTRDNGARNYVENLSKDSIDKELLLNIVKINALKNFNHEATLLSTNKNFNEDLSMDEFELLTLQAIKTEDMEEVRTFFDTHPDLYDHLIKSFVERRYFEPPKGISGLDNPEIMNWEYGGYGTLQNKIDEAFGRSKSY